MRWPNFDVVEGAVAWELISFLGTQLQFLWYRDYYLFTTAATYRLLSGRRLYSHVATTWGGICAVLTRVHHISITVSHWLLNEFRSITLHNRRNLTFVGHIFMATTTVRTTPSEELDAMRDFSGSKRCVVDNVLPGLTFWMQL